MSTRKTQAISGVSAGVENEITTVFPSNAATGLGRLIGLPYDSFRRMIGPRGAHFLYTVPTAVLTAPLSATLYLLQKAVGERYVLTNRALQKWRTIGQRLIAEVPLPQIARVDIDTPPGMAFYNASNLRVVGTDGKVVMVLEGVPYAASLRQTILEARDARQQTEAALATIRARQS